MDEHSIDINLQETNYQHYQKNNCVHIITLYKRCSQTMDNSKSSPGFIAFSQHSSSRAQTLAKVLKDNRGLKSVLWAFMCKIESSKPFVEPPDCKLT